MEINANIAVCEFANEQVPVCEVATEQIPHTIPHEELIKEVTDKFDAMEPYKAGIFQPCIKFISEFQADEESLDEGTTVSEGDMNDDTLADMTNDLFCGVNSLSNTEELYRLFDATSDNTNNIIGYEK